MPKIRDKSSEKEPTRLSSSIPLESRLQRLLPTIDDVFSQPVWYLDTGNYALNFIVSGRLDVGYKSGLTIELFGDNSTGKTVLLMTAVAEVQRIGGIAVVNDVERRWDWDFAKVHGIDPDKVIKAYPETVEEFATHTDILLDEILKETPIPKVLFVLDSIAALSTLWEMENIGVKEDQGKKAKRVKAIMRVLPKKLSRAGAILLCANHIIDNPNAVYGPKTTTPGGRGLALQASVRLEMYKPTLIKTDNKMRPYGATLHMRCVKNSECPPYGEANVDVLWSKGVIRESGLVDVAVDLGIIEKGGGWLSYNGKKWRESQIGEMIKETPLLQDPKWEKPYYLE